MISSMFPNVSQTKVENFSQDTLLGSEDNMVSEPGKKKG